VLILIGYQVWTSGLYGHGLLFDAAAYAKDYSQGAGGLQWAKGLIGLAFTGGCMLPILFYAPWIWRRIPPVLGLLMGGVVTMVGAAFAACWQGNLHLPIPPGGVIFGGVQFGLFMVGGLSVALLAAVELWRHRDPETWFLGIWIFGTFVFASFVNWSINGRSILPMVPAVAILLARHLDDVPSAPAGRSPAVLYGPVLLAAAIALAVTWADTQLASAVRATVASIEKKMRGDSGALWFQGHWGFQHYIEAIGGRPLDSRLNLLRAGDRVAIPRNNTNTWLLSNDRIASSEEFESEGPILLTTMQPHLGAGFYSNILGPLPFSFGHPPREGYTLILVKAPSGTQGLVPWR
jgi:hypothetical protein